MDEPRFVESTSSATDNWAFDQFVQEPGYLQYQEQLRGLIFHTAQTAAPTREGSPASSDSNSNNDVDPVLNIFDTRPEERHQDAEAQKQTKEILVVGRRLEYLKNYVAEVAPWLDMFDIGGLFTKQLPQVARRCPALLCGILALSARQLERKEGKQDSFDSLQLYQETIRLLGPLLQAHNLNIIPICTILCCLEMMSASPAEWRRHLEGCAALFDAFGVNGFSGGMLQGVFWCYARMDLCGALISDGTQATLVPMDKWLSPGASHSDASDLFRRHRSPDMHANYAVYLCAKVCELIAERTSFVELGEQNGCDSKIFEQRWRGLWDELQDWIRDRPAEMVPIKTIESRPFPQILLACYAGISSNQLYHTACILLLGCLPNGVVVESGTTSSAIWHAKRVCGISLTNPHQGCLNNAIQPLWIAGRLLSHKSEHLLLAQLIRSIESETGWGTSWRIADLESSWGYKVHI